MKKLLGWVGLLFLLLGTTIPAFSAEIVNTPNLTLNLGGRFQLLGELEGIIPGAAIRNFNRIYLFNSEDRLFANGNYNDVQFYFETAMGGEALNSSNNQINLLEFNASVPIHDTTLIVTAGQFKVPVNLESADYDGNMLFAEKSPLMQLFFNTGYDTGIALRGTSGNFDALIGTISGAPDLPQRYLPEIMKFPPMVMARIGYSDGIAYHPFHPKQMGFKMPKKSAFAIHLNGEYINDSNAGHATDLALQNGYSSVADYNSYYGNALLNSAFNPFLGKTAAGFGPVDATYWQTSVDLQYRAPLDGTVFTLQAQANVAKFSARNFTPVIIQNGTTTTGNIGVEGAEIQASVGNNPWIVAGRFAVVDPSNSLMTSVVSGGVTMMVQATGTEPIYEVTFPSITWNINSSTKIIAEGMGLIDTPVINSNDGTYIMTEMPSEISAGINTSAIHRASFIPVGRMMFQFSF